MVIKRDGTREKFDENKIIIAAKKAAAEVNCKKIRYKILVQHVVSEVSDEYGDMKVEDIQDSIERYFVKRNLYDVAKAFILYRERKKEKRNYVAKKSDFINTFIKSDNTANATIDDNANVNSKNVSVLNAEIHKEENKNLNIYLWDKKIKELFPELPKNSLQTDIDTVLYAHDTSSQVLEPYCLAVSMYPFIQDGIEKLGGLSAKPKNIDSYCGMLINLIFKLSSEVKGAVAVPEALYFFTMFAKKEWGDYFHKRLDVEITQNSLRKLTIRKQIYQYFQNITYSINQPLGARGSQAAFVNFSFFDKYFFEAIFSNMQLPEGNTPIEWEQFDCIQQMYLNWLNRERLKCMLTFPVCSYAVIVDENKEFKDKTTINYICKQYELGNSFFTYISDTPDSLSSCCFDGKQTILIKVGDDDTRLMRIEDAYKAYKDDTISTLSVDIHNTDVPYNERVSFKTAKLVKTNASEWFHILYDNNVTYAGVDVTHDHIFPVLRNGKIVDVKASEITNKDSFIINGTPERIISIEKYTRNKPCYCLTMEDQTQPYFMLPNGLVTHNCRLRNAITTNEFSFTNGNIGVMTGSKNVITLNLNRIIQDYTQKKKRVKLTDKLLDGINNHINSILDRVYKYHIAYNQILHDAKNSGLFTAYDAGFIHLDKQYLTIGISGLTAAAEYLGIDVSVNKKYKRFCQSILGNISTQNKLHKTKSTMFNTELVPAESAAAKLYNRDKEQGYWTPLDINLYTSYMFKPNDNNITIFDKLKLHGEIINEYLDGGSACHINLDKHLDKKQYRLILNSAAKYKCNYLTFNVPNSKCESCGFITKTPINKCPKCDSDDITMYDRIIG